MPDPFTFDFDGRNSLDMGIMARSYDFLMPPKRERRKRIPFRHGSHKSDGTFFDDRQLRLRCFWLNDKVQNLSRADVREITEWLSRQGRIVLDCEPDKHYVGELFDPAALAVRYDMAQEEIRTTHGEFEIIFTCDPFAIGARNTLPISRGNNAIEYSGTAESPTLIILRNPNPFPISTIVLTATSKIT